MKLGTILIVGSVLGPFAARAERLTPEIGVGTVRVEGNQVYYNDQPLQSEEAHALADACQELQAAATD